MRSFGVAVRLALIAASSAAASLRRRISTTASSGTSTRTTPSTRGSLRRSSNRSGSRIVDSGVDMRPARLPGQIVADEELRRRQPVLRHAGPRDVRRGPDRRLRRTTGSGSRASRSARSSSSPRSSARAADLARGRGAGDPLGRRQRRARDQPQPRRPARPARSDARHVLAARGVGGRATRTRSGVVVVAAVGNGDEAPTTPWPYASYPAALPARHRRRRARQATASVPAFSNRDPIFNDIAAPGEDIFSTFPRR